jgi:hypothetical protein
MAIGFARFAEEEEKSVLFTCLFFGEFTYFIFRKINLIPKKKLLGFMKGYWFDSRQVHFGILFLKYRLNFLGEVADT